ncbi:hypothetical protein [Streptomyces noursei]|uniref:hypothetical protein n=2 Tax=Streptomyces TaxID=1883 RepID=UPI0008343AEC
MVIFDRGVDRPQQGMRMTDKRTGGLALGIAAFNAALTVAAAVVTWNGGPSPWTVAAVSSVLVLLVLLRKR